MFLHKLSPFEKKQNNYTSSLNRQSIYLTKLIIFQNNLDPSIT